MQNIKKYIALLTCFLFLGSIFSISFHSDQNYQGFDVSCQNDDNPEDKSGVEIKSLNQIRLDGVNIGLVTSHGERSPRTFFINAIADVIQRGASVIDITTTLTSSLLSNFDILWFDESGASMPANELDTLEQWVLMGGSLFLIGDNGGTIDSIAQRFNIAYTGSGPGSGTTNAIYYHPITSNVNSIYFSSSMNSLDTSSQSIATLCVELNGYDQVVTLETGFGKLVIMADEIISDSILLQADNRLLSNNTFGWLGSSLGTTGLENYIMIPGYSYTWIDATLGSRCNLDGADDLAQLINLPFTFPFYENTFNNIYVCTNGFVSFDRYIDYYNVPFPTSSFYNMIAPYWDDLRAANPCNIYYRALSSPNRFVIEWKDIYSFGGSLVGSFEVILYETGDIIFSYDYLDYASSYTCGLNYGHNTNYYNIYTGLTPSTNDFSIYFEYVSTPLPPGPSELSVDIGTVITHGQNNPRTRYPNLISGLIERGATVTDITSSITLSLLSNYDIIWFDEYGSSMTTDELNAVTQWVYNGGKFIITGDNMGSAIGLVRRYNIDYGSSSISGGTSNTIYPHPITSGVNQVNFPSPMSYLIISSQPNADLCVELNNYDMVAATEYGYGRFVIIVDENVLTSYTSADNYLLFNNSFTWLASTTTFTPPVEPPKPILDPILDSIVLTVLLDLLKGSANIAPILIPLIILFSVFIAGVPIMIKVLGNKKIPEPSISRQKKRRENYASYKKLSNFKTTTVKKWSPIEGKKIMEANRLKKIANVFKTTKNYKSAIHFYEKALELNPSDRETKMVLSQLRIQLENKEREDLSIITPPPEQNHKNWYKIGLKSFKNGDYENAILNFKKEIEVTPEFREVWSKMGIAYGRLKNFQKMVECYKKVIELDQSDNKNTPKPDLSKADISKEENFTPAVKSQIKQVIIPYKKKITQNSIISTLSEPEKRKTSAKDCYIMGSEFLLLKNYEKAIGYFKRVVEIEPKYKEAWYELARCYSSTGDIQRVIDCNLKAIVIDPKLKNAWVLLASAYLVSGNYQKTIKCYEKVVEIDPQLKSAWDILEVLYNNFGQRQSTIMI